MKLVVLLLLGLTVSHDVEACSCSKRPSPAEAYRSATAVFVGTIVSVEHEKLEIHRGGKTFTFPGGVLATVDVEEQWRGPKLGQFVVSTGARSCGLRFEEGARYLIYANRTGDHWSAGGVCGRSRPVWMAIDDLDSLEKRRHDDVGTLLRGEVKKKCVEKSVTFTIPVPGSPVIVEKDGVEVASTTTDQMGGFEFLNLPPAKYVVRVAAPEGVRVWSPRELVLGDDWDVVSADFQMTGGDDPPCPFLNTD